MLSKQQMSPKCNHAPRAVPINHFALEQIKCRKFKTQCFQLLCSLYLFSAVLRFNHPLKCIFRVIHQLWRSSLEYRHLLEGKAQLRNDHFLGLILPVFHSAPLDWHRLKEHNETLQVRAFLPSFYSTLPQYNSSLA